MERDIESGIVKIDGQELPGVLEHLSVRHEIIIDEIRIQDRDGHLKQPAGYDEGDVTLSLQLQDDEDPYSLIAPIQALFREPESQGKPKIHTVTNVHVNARGIHEVLFKSLETSETNRDDIIIASIALEEYVPLEIQVVQAVEQANQESETQQALAEAVPDTYPDGAGTPGGDRGK